MKEKPTNRGRKKPYQPPRLVRYGTVSELTGAKGGAKGDGSGVPRTKV